MDELLQEVPLQYRERFVEIVELIERFCTEHLNEEYKELCVEMALLLCDEDSPVQGGKAASWACGIVYSLGWVNFLSDPSRSPCMTALEIAKGFGISEATLMSKSRVIRADLDLVRLDPYWTLPSRLDDNPLVWMMKVNGIIVDVRLAPYEFQKAAFEAGRTPYIPSERVDAPVKLHRQSEC